MILEDLQIACDLEFKHSNLIYICLKLKFWIDEDVQLFSQGTKLHREAQLRICS